MKQAFKLKSTPIGFFNMYVELMSVKKPISTLRRQEKRVLSELMYWNYMLSKDYTDREDHKKWNALFDYDQKLKMRERLNVSEATMANALTSLRKCGLLSSDNYLHTSLRLYPSSSNSIEFNFELKDD